MVIIMNEPLAYKLRPNSIKEVIGQKHLVDKDKIIYNMIKNNKIFSMILYGKPGIGKTSIANAITSDLNQKTRSLNAVINNKKDFDVVIEEAKMYKGIILIIDEIHRMNKDKQDLLLPYIENGLIVIIGLTASNPYHTINPAIRSRCQLFELKELTDKDIKEGIKRAIKSEYLENITIDNQSIDYIVKLSGGDLRYAYNLLELAYYSSKDKSINIELLTTINNKPSYLNDKNQDGYYDLLSAFQKSIRGSDVDASLHYLGRLILGGDFDSIFRRMTVIAYEDIGLANPGMGPKVMACIDACERLGMPEMIIPLGVTIIELALSPKSNSANVAINKALEDIEQGNIGEVPKHINSSAFGYKYPHDYPDSFVEQDYLPEKLKDAKYYNPKTNSKYEQALKQMYDKYKKNRL